MAQYVSLVALLAVVCLGHGASNDTCPTWLYRTGETGCACGSTLGIMILCSNETQEVKVIKGFCLTSFDQDDRSSKAVFGRCLYAQASRSDSGALYQSVSPNISEQDEQLCSYLNCQGRLCGTCKPSHSVSAYSYDLKCYQCHRGLLSNILMYLAVAYIPLTLFLILVMAFHISVTSPYFSAAILICQILALPGNVRYMVQVMRGQPILIPAKFIATLYGIWNLDFFRTVLPPICLPLNSVQMITLDYLVAIYPLFLLVCFYVLVTAHDSGYRPIVRVWRPFLRCAIKLRRQWNSTHSIIDAFATFLLLSYMKFINTSVDLLIYTKLFDERGSRVGYFFYYNATVEFMGTGHLPYAILALVVLFLGALFPVLLIVYPMKWFQRILNRCRCNSPALRTLMECFQGHYRDRTDGGWECRYFAAVYPTFRIGSYILYILTHSNEFFAIGALMIIACVVITLVVLPYKMQYNVYNILDPLLIMTMLVYTSGFLVASLPYDWDEIGPEFGYVISGVFSLTPIVYFAVLLGRRIKQGIKKGSLTYKWNKMRHPLRLAY